MRRAELGTHLKSEGGPGAFSLRSQEFDFGEVGPRTVFLKLPHRWP
jgi:hypothetical protein